MAGLGFTPTDFAVFKIQGFSARMQEIYARVRPKLMRLGDELAPELARKLHLEFFPHVARHARRTLNPPPETWAAFGPSPKGYKRYGYLALCISGAGLHARMVVKAEADRRPEIARGLKSQCRPAREVAARDGSRALREMGFQNAARTDGGRRRAFHGARRGARQKEPAGWTSGSDGACATRCGWIAPSCSTPTASSSPCTESSGPSYSVGG